MSLLAALFVNFRKIRLRDAVKTDGGREGGKDGQTEGARQRQMEIKTEMERDTGGQTHAGSRRKTQS